MSAHFIGKLDALPPDVLVKVVSAGLRRDSYTSDILTIMCARQEFELWAPTARWGLAELAALSATSSALLAAINLAGSLAWC